MIVEQPMRTQETQTGFMAHELTVLATVLLLLVAVILTMVTSARRTEEYAERSLRVAARGQRVLDEIHAELTAAVAVFRERDGGRDLRRTLKLPETTRPIPFTRLPRNSSSRTFEKELKPAGRTGNALLLAVSAGTRKIPLESATQKGAICRIDVYRIVAYYLTREASGPDSETGAGLNLCRFESVPVADADQIAAIEDPLDRRDVLRALAAGAKGDGYADPVRHVWRQAAPAHDAKSSAAADAKSFATIDVESHELVPCEALPANPRRSRHRLFDYSHHSVATNLAHQSVGVSYYGCMTETDGGFPHGFEVQLAASPTGRKAMLHLNVITTATGVVPASADLRSIVLLRERKSRRWGR